MIRFENVYKRYPNGRDALASVSFRLERGEMAFLTGPSGAGKSTLLKLIALIERPSRGTVLIGNRNTSKVRRRQIPGFRRQLGIVFQDHKLLNDRTVFDNIALPLVIGALRRREIGRRVRAALDQVGLLGYEKHLPEALSSGEQQRVGIARAIASRPELVIADEPTGNLDPDLSSEIFGLFERFNEVGVTVLVATHDIGVIAERDYRHIRLTDGKLVATEHC
jgi:cell division transport system ATP-binding protein